MEDLSRVVGSPKSIVLNGRQFFVSELTPRGCGDLQAYLKEVIPDPLVQARQMMEGLPPDIQKQIYFDALAAHKKWPPEFDDPGVVELFLTSEGQARMLWILCRKNTLNLTLDESRRFFEHYELSTEEFGRLWQLASGREVGDLVDPKAEALVPQG